MRSGSTPDWSTTVLTTRAAKSSTRRGRSAPPNVRTGVRTRETMAARRIGSPWVVSGGGEGGSLEPLAVFRVSDGEHPGAAFGERAAAEVRHAVLRDDHTGVGPWRADRAVEALDDATAVARRRRQRDDRQPARRPAGAAEEVHRSADRTDVRTAGDLRVDLPREVDLERGGDRDEAVDRGQPGVVVRIPRIADLQERV